VENMAYFCCKHSSERIEIFGAGGGEALSRSLEAPLLASLPIDIELRKGGDAGAPLVLRDPESGLGRQFATIALEIEAQYFRGLGVAH
jgi:ATP-binding protein involved in chromosome partitioning